MAGGGWDSVALRAPCAAGHPQLRRGFTDSPGVFEGRLLGEGSTAGLSESAAQRVGGLARLPPGALACWLLDVGRTFAVGLVAALACSLPP